jgi:hypothetical protein
MDGVALCSRYAFGPNRLHMCGPDMNREVLAYLTAGATDQGLADILRNFKTLYPYLREIASANQISDPFDRRVVEAYWIGNELLEHISPKNFYHHLVESFQAKKRFSPKVFERLQNKLAEGAKMHHTFHVFNIWQTGGQNDLASFDQCRVSWGEVVKVDGPAIAVLRRPLILLGGKFTLGSAMSVDVARQLEGSPIMDEVKIGDVISIHWGVPCEILIPQQAANLEKYTQLSIGLANQTL